MDRAVVITQWQFLDDNGDPLAGGKVHTYDAGTTDNKTTYKEKSLTTAHTNPIVLDSAGRIPSGDGVFCQGTLKVVVKTSADVTVITMDNLRVVDIANVSALGFGGLTTRSTMVFTSVNQLDFRPGAYHHDGTTEQIVYWDSTLAKAVSGLTASTWYYVYLDDSAIVTLGTNLITATELLFSTTAPSWTAAKHGFYNGSDRCIGAFRTDGSGDLALFEMNGDVFMLEDPITVDTAEVITNAWEAVTANIPTFVTLGLYSITWDYVDTDTFLLTAPSSSASNGHRLAYVASGGMDKAVVQAWIANTATTFQLKTADASANTVDIYAIGYKFPNGM